MIPLAPVLAALVFALPHLEPERARALAHDIAIEADTPNEARALVSTLVVESGGREAVEHCTVTGDNGHAWSLYQLNAPAWKIDEHGRHSRKEICASNRLATHLAARALRALGGNWGNWESALAWYVGRGTARSDRRIAARVRLFRALTRRSQS